MQNPSLTSLPIFDYTKLSDPEIKRLYQRIMSVSDQTAIALSDAYGGDRMPIEACIVDDENFQASVGIEDDRYLILFSRPLPILVRILFDKILEHPTVLPWLPMGNIDERESKYDVPFVIDPMKFDSREHWGIQLSGIRSFAAGTLADLCLCFITLHEFGHILCGHSEGVQHYENESQFREFIEPTRRLPESVERSQAWEYDADVFAVTLLIQFVSELVDDVEVNSRTEQLLNSVDDQRAHALALAVASLFVLFSYLQGMRYNLQLTSSHPHPMVRVEYIKDMLVTAAREKFSFDEEAFFELMDKRLDEVMIALQDNSLLDASIFTDDHIAEIRKQKKELVDIQKRNRKSCSQWCWISWK